MGVVVNHIRALALSLPLFVLSSVPLAAQGEAPAATPAAPAEAPPAPIPAAAFAAHSPFASTRLSPDGERIVTIATIEGQQYVALIDADERNLIGRNAVGENNSIEWVRWAGNDRLLLSLSSTGRRDGEEVLFTRLAVINLVAKETRVLGAKYPAVEGDDLVHVAKDGSFVLVAIQRSLTQYPSVVRFDLDSEGATSLVQRPIERGVGLVCRRQRRGAAGHRLPAQHHAHPLPRRA